jgi:hypothetical protein
LIDAVRRCSCRLQRRTRARDALIGLAFVMIDKRTLFNLRRHQLCLSCLHRGLSVASSRGPAADIGAVPTSKARVLRIARSKQLTALAALRTYRKYESFPEELNRGITTRLTRSAFSTQSRSTCRQGPHANVDRERRST